MDPIYDTHAHLDFKEFSSDLDAVLDRAQAAGVTRILTIGCDTDSSRRAVALAERHPAVYAAVGWHPGHVGDAPADVRPELRDLAAHPRVVAIGECGMDLFRALPAGDPGRDALASLQRRVFEQQLEVAAAAGLPCVFHQRAAWAETLAVWEPFHRAVRGVFHCFVGTPDEARTVVSLGAFVSFTGILTFKNGASVRETLASLPDGSFFLETDCPFLAPDPHRGRRCEPAHVADIARVAATVRGCTPAELSRTTCAAVHHLFPRLA